MTTSLNALAAFDSLQLELTRAEARQLRVSMPWRPLIRCNTSFGSSRHRRARLNALAAFDSLQRLHQPPVQQPSHVSMPWRPLIRGNTAAR